MPLYELNLYDYWRIVRKRKWVLAGITAIVVLTTYLYSMNQPVIYNAMSRVRVEQRRAISSLLITELILYQPGSIMPSQAEVVKSSAVMEIVAAMMELKKQGVFENDPKYEETLTKTLDSLRSKPEFGQAVASLQGMVKAEQKGDTDIIEITVRGDNAELVIDLVNFTAHAYKRHNLQKNKEQATGLREFVEKERARAAEELREAQTELKKFEEEDLPQLGEYLLLQDRLPGLRADLTSLLEKYTEKHPDVQALTGRIAEIENKLKALPSKRIQYENLKQTVKEKSDGYESFSRKYQEARIAESDVVSDVSVIDTAAMAGLSNTNVSVNIIVGLILGMMLGFTGAFIAEHLDTSIGTIEDVEEFIGLPVLGVIPHIEIPGEKQRFPWAEKKRSNLLSALRARLVVQHDPKSSIAEAYRVLRTNIQFVALEEKKKVIMFSSAGPLEGKSITCANYCVTLSQAGQKTLLIDADLRRPSVHKMFGLEKEPGLSDILVGTVELDEAVRSLADILSGSLFKGYDASKVRGIDNLHIVTSGPLPPNPSELINSRRMDTLLGELRGRYDVVVFDCTPLLPVADASLLGAKMDGVMLVYQVGKTARAAFRRAKVQLDSVKAKILGVLLNDLGTSELEPRSAYYYYRKYYAEEKVK